MPLGTPTNPAILLVAPDENAWTTLRSTTDILDQFELRWERSPHDDASALPREPNARSWKAVIVASPDAQLPAQWSGRTGLLTIRVPVETSEQTALSSLCDEAGQLPSGPAGGVFATMAIGSPGAKNAALFVVAALAANDSVLRGKWLAFRERQTAQVLAEPSLTLEN